MKLSDRVKIALEETRILILGDQILLGFGFRGVIDDRFDQLPAYARYADGVGLRLLVCAIGLLIAPVPITASSTPAKTAAGCIASRRSSPIWRCCHSRWRWEPASSSARRRFRGRAPSRSRRARWEPVWR